MRVGGAVMGGACALGSGETLGPEHLKNRIGETVVLEMEVAGVGLSGDRQYIELYSQERWDMTGTVFIRVPVAYQDAAARFGLTHPENMLIGRKVQVAGTPAWLSFTNPEGSRIPCITLKHWEELTLKESPYDELTLHGFTLRIDHREHAASFREVKEILAILDRKLQEISARVPKPILSEFQKVPITIRRSIHRSPAAYDWSDADASGRMPAQWQGIMIRNWYEFIKVSGDDQPLALLHEFAHAYHHRVLGGDHPGILSAFQHAVESKRYEKVPRLHADPQRAYALTNEREYFCEITEAWFGFNDFFPFNAVDLKTHDPEGARLMEAVWGTPPPRTVP